MTEAIFPTIAFFASIPSVYLELSISLVLLGGCFIGLRYVDESTIRADPGSSGDVETTGLRHPSEATTLPDQISRQRNLLTLLRSRKVLFTLVVFTVPVFAQTALRTLVPYFLAKRRPDQSLQQVLLSIFPGEVFRVILFALFTPWAISFVERRWRICGAEIDTWMIRGSLLLLAFSGAFVTSATTFASRTIGESVSETPRRDFDPITDHHSCCDLRNGLRFEGVIVVIHYFPGKVRAPWATLWFGSGRRNGSSTHRVAYLPRCLRGYSQGWPVARTALYYFIGTLFCYLATRGPLLTFS